LIPSTSEADASELQCMLSSDGNDVFLESNP